MNIAFLIHYHQPYYAAPDDMTNSQPWVRLHASRDYLNIGSLLKQYPNIRVTFSFSSSLLEQLKEYSDNDYQDKFQQLTIKDPGKMNLEEKEFLLSNIFDLYSTKSGIDFPGWNKLSNIWAERVQAYGVEKAVEQTSDGELLDAQVLHLLSWSGWDIIQTESIRDLLTKTDKFTENDKEIILAVHSDVLNRIIPMFNELSDSGQAELAMSPYYNPILPLLIDNDYGKIADRYCDESSLHFAHPEDALYQIHSALNYCNTRFGDIPNGMWLPEGSVCYETLEHAAKEGLKWLISDDQVLSHTLKEQMSDEKKYQAHKINGIENCPALFFRSSELSEAISFNYSKLSPEQAVKELIRNLEEIRESLSGDETEYLVTIVLDGENSWEYYPKNGYLFFNELFSVLSESDTLKTISFDEYLKNAADIQQLETLSPGSSVDCNFNSWIGQEQTNRAWDVLAEAREVLKEAKQMDNVDKEPFKGMYNAAHKHLMAAEGADWFWWYGKNRFLSHSILFDNLFRAHLQKVYTYLNLPVPDGISEPLESSISEEEAPPEAEFSPEIDGIETESDEWQSAGHLKLEESTGNHASHIIKGVKYGFDSDYIYLRLDGDMGILKSTEESVRIELCVVKPIEVVISIPLSENAGKIQLVSNNVQKVLSEGKVAFQEFIEIKIPMDDLSMNLDEKFYFFIKLKSEDKELERLPLQGVIKANFSFSKENNLRRYQ